MMRALVIDDHPDIREFATEILSVDFDVTTARDGQEGMRLTRDTFFDLVLVDIFMPHKDGIEVVRELSDVSPKSKIVAMTSELKGGATDYLGVAQALGATAAIAKPFSPAELMGIVETALQG